MEAGGGGGGLGITYRVPSEIFAVCSIVLGFLLNSQGCSWHDFGGHQGGADGSDKCKACGDSS